MFYYIGMELTLPALTPGAFWLIVTAEGASAAGRAVMSAAIARLALRGPVRILDGGNRYDAYAVARAVRRQTTRLDDVLRQVRVSRTFTCYQMAALLNQTPANADEATLVLRLLSTFYDEDVKLGESLRLLETCLGHLHRLGARAPLVVSARTPRPGQEDRQILLDMLQAAAGEVFWVEEEPAPVYTQLPAFSEPAGQQLPAKTSG